MSLRCLQRAEKAGYGALAVTVDAPRWVLNERSNPRRCVMTSLPLPGMLLRAVVVSVEL